MYFSFYQALDLHSKYVARFWNASIF